MTLQKSVQKVEQQLEERKNEKKPSEFTSITKEKSDNSEVDANILLVSQGNEVLS